MWVKEWVGTWWSVALADYVLNMESKTPKKGEMQYGCNQTDFYHRSCCDLLGLLDSTLCRFKKVEPDVT